MGGMLLVGVAMGAVPATTVGCSAGLPSAAHVRGGASTIALVRVQAVQGDPADPTGYTVDVLGEIKGQLADPARIPALQATICGDTISVLERTRMVLALELPFQGRTIAPYWIVEPDDTISGGAGRLPAGGLSLEELLAELGGMPDTSAGTRDAGTAPEAGRPLALVALWLLVGLWFVQRRYVARRLGP